MQTVRKSTEVVERALKLFSAVTICRLVRSVDAADRLLPRISASCVSLRCAPSCRRRSRCLRSWSAASECAPRASQLLDA